MRRKGLFVPKLHDRTVRKLYHHAHQLHIPVSTLLNLIVVTSLEQLEEVDKPTDYVLLEEGKHAQTRMDESVYP